jgi:chromosome partitioning protein
MAKAQVISLVQMKGGVGKTTCAVNLASYLARDHNKKVLLVDFDPQTNASLSLMTEARWGEWQREHGTMADILEVENKTKHAGGFKLADCIVQNVVPEIPGLDLIPSHLKLTFLDLDLAARPGRERIFARKLEKILPSYDLILCDCPPNLMTATQNALYASDWYLVPMQPDFLSSIGLSLLKDRLSYLRKSLEFQIRCLGVRLPRVVTHSAQVPRLSRRPHVHDAAPPAEATRFLYHARRLVAQIHPMREQIIHIYRFAPPYGARGPAKIGRRKGGHHHGEGGGDDEF